MVVRIARLYINMILERIGRYIIRLLETICHDILSEPIKVDSTSSTVKIDIEMK